MFHPIARAAEEVGFAEARSATAHPLDAWREKLNGVPFGKIFSMEHRPEAICGWPVEKTTVWCAITETPPFDDWPHGFGKAAGYYASLPGVEEKTARWARAVDDMGYDVVADPDLPDRALAIRAGLGIHGLFGPMITPGHGSFVSISTLLVRTPPPSEARGPEHDLSHGCDGCGKCAEACPAKAISEQGFDAMKCLRKDMSYPADMPEEHYPLMGTRIMGCDICQRACPRNHGVAPLRPTASFVAPFKLESLLDGPDLDAIAARITERYTRRERILTQAVLAAANTGRTDLLPRVRKRCEDEDPALRRAAAWATAMMTS